LQQKKFLKKEILINSFNLNAFFAQSFSTNKFYTKSRNGYRTLPARRAVFSAGVMQCKRTVSFIASFRKKAICYCQEVLHYTGQLSEKSRHIANIFFEYILFYLF
jgi:hypothetical protein